MVGVSSFDGGASSITTAGGGVDGVGLSDSENRGT